MASQVTLVRTLTAIVKDPGDKATPGELLALWELATNYGRIIRDEVEILGQSQAGMVCHTCLEPLEMRLWPADVKVKQGQVAFGQINRMDLYCSADRTHEVVADNYAAAKAILENIGA